MQGVLARYGPGSAHLCFISSGTSEAPKLHASRPRHVVCIGGLSDGLTHASYVPPLATALSEAGWTLVQAQLQSCYESWGIGSLDQDADDLQTLLEWLRTTQACTGVVLLGHSTGCQDIARLLQRIPLGTPAPWPLVATVLQAAVSDREYLCKFPELEPVAERARQLVAAGREEEIVARLSGGQESKKGTPVTARRLLALYERGGDDDYFSSDLSDDSLNVLLSPVGRWPCMVVIGDADEYALGDAATIVANARRLVCAIQTGSVGKGRSDWRRSPVSELLVVKGAGHSLDGHESEFVAAMVRFLGACETS
mmetsp:Transcript_17477/g.29979  ORF Transcript_17477/g.29979 Transcript_17477/m.29979 type:complete len:311 (+) Transcript_17477:28-960(+)